MSARKPLDRKDVLVPVWALAHLPEVAKGDTFRSYWARVGVPAEVIDAAFDGLLVKTAEVAHERIAEYVRRTCSQSFEKYVASRLSVVRRP